MLKGGGDAVGEDQDRRSAARAALSGLGFAPLWDAARRRLEGNGATITASPLVLRDLDPASRAAIGGLLGAVVAEGEPLRVRPDRLDALLRRGAAEIGLVDQVVAVGGPLQDRRADRAADRRVRDEVWTRASSHEAVARHPALEPWLADLRRSGSATRLAGGVDGLDELVQGVLDVLGRLPATEVVTLAGLAAEVTGDAHALDRGEPLGSLAAGALQAIGVAEPDEPDGSWLGPREVEAVRALDWRRAWATVGVLCDDLSVSALALNLPVRSSPEVIAEAVHEHGQVGQPLRLTLRQLATAALEVVPGAVVRVCENPSVVGQAAELLGPDCGALVCTEGVPDSAVGALLDLLVDGGAALRYHGDLDWGGLAIANQVLARWGAQPWRMGADDYRAAALSARKPLTGRRVAASWDDALAPAMEELGLAVHEEQVMADLMADLARDGPRR